MKIQGTENYDYYITISGKSLACEYAYCQDTKVADFLCEWDIRTCHKHWLQKLYYLSLRLTQKRFNFQPYT